MEVVGPPASLEALIVPWPVSEAAYIEAWLKNTHEPLPASSPSTRGLQVAGVGLASPSVVTNFISAKAIQHE